MRFRRVMYLLVWMYFKAVNYVLHVKKVLSTHSGTVVQLNLKEVGKVPNGKEHIVVSLLRKKAI